MKKNLEKKNFFLCAILTVLFVSISFAPALAAEKLAIQKLLLADDIKGFAQYTPHAGSRYTLEDECWIYLEATGCATPAVSDAKDEYSLNLAADILVKRPQSGQKLAFQPDIATLVTTLRSKSPTQFLAIGFGLKGWTPGNYSLEIGLRDNLSGQTVSQDLALQVAKPTEADIKAKQERETKTKQQ
ncbi:MAG: hypothetical protein LBR61_08150 [Synergistaceae bacterium]|nr:hypothetical protein [Synergistaceae bacterium]